MEIETRKTNGIFLLLALALIIFGVRLEVIDAFAVMTPYWDDWGMGGFLNKSITQNLGFIDFVHEANEHRLVFNRLLSLALFNANQQQWDPMVMMVANSLIWTISGLFIVHFARQNAHSINVTIFVGFLLLLWTLPLSLVNILWGIQTHTYTMILFSILGCWYSGKEPLSIKWWFGIFSLAAASLTLAGGTFAAFAVVGTQALIWISNSDNRRKSMTTLLAACATGIFGLILILIQDGNSAPPAHQTFISSAKTFFITLAWPMAKDVWPAFVFMAPILVLAVQSIKNRTVAQPMTRFALSLYGFVVIVALAIAYARGADGMGPARRYFEFLALSSVASFLSLLLIYRAKSAFSGKLFIVLLASWISVFIWALPWLSYVSKATLQERSVLKPIQEKLVKHYLASKDKQGLLGQPFRHVPFPDPHAMATILDDFKSSDILPYTLQAPSPIIRHPDTQPKEKERSAFIKNGTFKASTATMGFQYFNEDVFGSYKPRDNGMKATGKFESGDFRIDRPYVAIPVTGYLGFNGLSLTLSNVLTGEKIAIEPNQVSSDYAERWRHILVKAPRGYYRLIAEDQNPKLWFGFATPRTVGRMSYQTQTLLDHGHWVWKIGLFLLFLALRDQITMLFANTRIHSPSKRSINPENHST